MARELERDIQAGDRGRIARIQAFYIQSSAPRQASIRTIRHLPAGLRPTGWRGTITRCDMVLAIGDTASFRSRADERVSSLP
jgi:hypothetical protein